MRIETDERIEREGLIYGVREVDGSTRSGVIYGLRQSTDRESGWIRNLIPIVGALRLDFIVGAISLLEPRV